jgi:hypothetical protein
MSQRCQNKTEGISSHGSIPRETIGGTKAGFVFRRDLWYHRPRSQIGTSSQLSSHLQLAGEGSVKIDSRPLVREAIPVSGRLLDQGVAVTPDVLTIQIVGAMCAGDVYGRRACVQ